MSNRHTSQPFSVDSFDGLYDKLAQAWESHQHLRSSFPDVADLALSAVRLDEARSEMWTWWKQNRIESN
jgi:hypothetical protein